MADHGSVRDSADCDEQVYLPAVDTREMNPAVEETVKAWARSYQGLTEWLIQSDTQPESYSATDRRKAKDPRYGEHSVFVNGKQMNIADYLGSHWSRLIVCSNISCCESIY